MQPIQMEIASHATYTCDAISICLRCQKQNLMWWDAYVYEYGSKESILIWRFYLIQLSKTHLDVKVMS